MIYLICIILNVYIRLGIVECIQADHFISIDYIFKFY